MKKGNWVTEVTNMSKDELANIILNKKVREHVDYDDDESDPRGHGKRFPYIGWYWRDIDFIGKCISIGDCGNFIGVIENNKWGHPERVMTKEEVVKIISLLQEFFNSSDKRREEKAQKIWVWFQTLKIPGKRLMSAHQGLTV